MINNDKAMVFTIEWGLLMDGSEHRFFMVHSPTPYVFNAPVTAMDSSHPPKIKHYLNGPIMMWKIPNHGFKAGVEKMRGNGFLILIDH